MTYRQPRANLIVNGATLLCEEISVSTSRDHKSDSFSATTSLSSLPAGMDANWWSTANDISVQVMIDIGNGAVKIFDGKADSVDHDFEAGKLKVSGRDKAAKLIDKKSSTKFLNQKPDAIVQQLAGNAGLEVDIDSVDEKAGKLFQIDYDAIQHRMSDWTAIQQLADAYGRVAYMTAGKVYFKDPEEQLPVLKVQYQAPTADGPANGNSLKLSARRSINLGRPIKHNVHSWNHKQAKLNEGTFTEPGSGDPIEWNHYHPGLSKDQADKRAKDHCGKTTKHELGVTVEMPGDPTVTPRFMLELSGTNTAYDQQHEISSIEHRISQRDGYTMSINTKAKSKKRGGGSTSKSSSASKSGSGGSGFNDGINTPLPIG